LACLPVTFQQEDFTEPMVRINTDRIDGRNSVERNIGWDAEAEFYRQAAIVPQVASPDKCVATGLPIYSGSFSDRFGLCLSHSLWQGAELWPISLQYDWPLTGRIDVQPAPAMLASLPDRV